MRTRTHLTTPPGQTPHTEDERRRDDERYSPGFAVPEEPSVPGRHRRTLVTLAVLVVLAAAAVLAFRWLTAGQGFDPALEQPAVTETPPSETRLDPSGGTPAGG